MYPWQRWLDHVTDPSNLFTVIDNGNGTWIITPAGTVMQQGTPQDQTHFNNMECGILDAHVAHSLLLNFIRQTGWRVDDLECSTMQEVGAVTLTNSVRFPFNNSRQFVALQKHRENANYIVVILKAAGVGNIGEIEVADRMPYGFNLSYTGSASSVAVEYAVIGG